MFNKIQKLLIENKISMTKLSREIGISQGNISDWKSGRSKPKMEALRRIAEYFKIPISYFFDSEEDSKNESVEKVVDILNETAIKEMERLTEIWDKLTAQDRREMLRFAEFLAFKNKIVVE